MANDKSIIDPLTSGPVEALVVSDNMVARCCVSRGSIRALMEYD